MSYRCRWFEYLNYRPLLQQYFDEDTNFRHEAAPKPRLTDADYHPDYLSDKIGVAKRLQWAEENEATVAEMKAWRRALKGEDLTTEAEFDDWSGDPGVAFVPTEASPVLDPDSFDGSGEGGSRGSAADSPELVSAVARDADGGAGGGDYSPYRQGAASPPPKESGGVTAVVEKPLLSAEQMLKRAVTTLERINKALTEEMLQEIKKQPQKKRDRLVKVVGEISSKTAKLM